MLKDELFLYFDWQDFAHYKSVQDLGASSNEQCVDYYLYHYKTIAVLLEHAEKDASCS